MLDAVDGYHSVLLDEESQPLTTFNTEWGRYKYARMPQGFLASGDAYTSQYDSIIAEVPRKVKIVDDVQWKPVKVNTSGSRKSVDVKRS